MLTEQAPGLWSLPTPLSFYGLQFGTRMTVVHTPDGLFVHSPVALTPALREAVSALGEPRWLVGPNLFHHLFLGDWKAAFPDAELWGPPGLAAKRPDLTLDGRLGRDTPGWAAHLEQLPIEGMGRMQETAFFHPASASLVVADLLQNVDDSPHWATRIYLRLTGLRGRPGLSPVLRTAFTDRAAGRRAIDALLEWPFQRVVLAHGEVLERDPQAHMKDAWTWLK